MNGLADCRYIGLTGGIGTGKTTAANAFRSRGALVLDADEVSRHALDPGKKPYEETVAAFGKDILDPDGTIKRPALAKIVFSDEEKRQVLNSIIHPYVKETLLKGAEEAGADQLVVFDVPLLFESGMDALCHTIVAVAASQDIRVQRVMLRDHCTEEQVLGRMAAQMDQDELIRRADYVLYNDGTPEELAIKASALYDTLYRL